MNSIFLPPNNKKKVAFIMYRDKNKKNKTKDQVVRMCQYNATKLIGQANKNKKETDVGAHS
jgi:hypothetical protein